MNIRELYGIKNATRRDQAARDTMLASGVTPSKHFTCLVRVPGEVGVSISIPAPARFCPHCKAELRPASFAGVSYAECPNACMDTWAECGPGISDHDGEC